MKETISKNEKSLNILNKLIQNGYYNGLVESEKFELTRNHFPNNYKLIGILNHNGEFEINSSLKIGFFTSGKILSFIGITLSLFSFILLKRYWLFLTSIFVIAFIIYLTTKIKGKKEVKMFTSKFLDFYKTEYE